VNETLEQKAQAVAAGIFDAGDLEYNAKLILAALSQVALEEADWWQKHGHCMTSPETVAHMAALRESAAKGEK
jgi:hypothetical protein